MLRTIKRMAKIIRARARTENLMFGSGANIGWNAKFEGQNKVGAHSWFEGYMGYGTYIGDNCIIKAKIGRFCSIGHSVVVLTGTHPSSTFVSTSPMFYSLGMQNGATLVKKQKFDEQLYINEQKGYGVAIGNDVWIGYGAILMGGVRIGDGSIVASGALVRHDVEPYTIVAGQPAKPIRKRFEDWQICELQSIQWWNKPIDWIQANADTFENIDEFLKSQKSLSEHR